MTRTSNPIDVYLEIGKKRVFAGAIDWPGWSRCGRDEEAALQALLDSAPRYARILHAAQIEFPLSVDAPSESGPAFTVVERVEGNSTTDFGAPDIAPEADARPVDDVELQRLQTLLKAYWQAFDAAVQAAAGKELRKGPRGGGRDLDGIIQHVLGADANYLGRLAWKFTRNQAPDLRAELARTRQAILEALTAAVREGLPARGPRGGVIWLPRYFVRRVAWHVIDHAWEIEDRIV